MEMLKIADDTLNLKLWGVLPVKYIAEAIEAEAQDEDADFEKIHILAIEIQEKADEMIKCIERIDAAETTDTAE